MKEPGVDPSAASPPMSQHDPSTQTRQSSQFGTARRGQQQRPTNHPSQPGQQMQQGDQQMQQGDQQMQQGDQQTHQPGQRTHRPGQQTQQGGQQMQPPSERLYPTKNTLPEAVRRASIAALDRCLADVVVLQFQLKDAHWNVKGPTFYMLHELFEDVAEMLGDYADAIAERVTALGGRARGTVRMAAQNASIPPMDPNVADSRAMLDAVATSLATFDATLYRNLEQVSEQGDLDTADLLNEVSREVSKALWLVESHLQQGSANGQRA